MKRDELDRKHRSLFAWRIWKPGEALDFPSTDDSAAPTLSPPSAGSGGSSPTAEDVGIPVNADVDIDEALEKSRPECAAIEREVGEAWLQHGEPQVRSTRAILRRVAKVGVALIGLGKLPSIRLARLVTRHYRRLSPVQRSDCGYIFGLDLSHAESLELVVEAAHSHADIVHLMSAGDDRSERPSWASPACVARLAAVIEESPKARLHALDLVSHCALADARPILRKALHRPEWPARASAAKLLWTLAELGAEDCMFLLGEATLPRKRATASVYHALEVCAETLREALPQVRPEGGELALLCIVNDPLLADTIWLGGHWALQTLAAAYPKSALAPIDRRMRMDGMMDRLLAVTAVSNLPDADAQPRLIHASGDPLSCVADWARSNYYRRFGARCPEDPLAFVARELLSEAPSAQMLSRLGVLRVVSTPTRAAWAETLLTEAPDGEALALLVFVLAAEGVSALTRASLPKDERDWAKLIFERFGPSRGLDGLLALARRFPFSRGAGWLTILTEKVEDGSVLAEDRERVRAFAQAEFACTPHNEAPLRRLLDLT